MTILSATLTIVSAALALMLWRCGNVSLDRADKIKALRHSLRRERARLDCASGKPGKVIRLFYMEEEAEAYNVCVKSYLRDDLFTSAVALVKTFPFEDDKDFARRQAEELVDKLREE